jgi:hypothetical protein
MLRGFVAAILSDPPTKSSTSSTFSELSGGEKSASENESPERANQSISAVQGD